MQVAGQREKRDQRRYCQTLESAANASKTQRGMEAAEAQWTQPSFRPHHEDIHINVSIISLHHSSNYIEKLANCLSNVGISSRNY
jgi:hypothetical protein